MPPRRAGKRLISGEGGAQQPMFLQKENLPGQPESEKEGLSTAPQIKTVDQMSAGTPQSAWGSAGQGPRSVRRNWGSLW